MDKAFIKFFLSPWYQELFNKITHVSSELILITPWVKHEGARLVIDALEINPSRKKIQTELITRLGTKEFINNSSDLEAFSFLFNHINKFQTRCVSNLHAKVYIFDKKSMIVTSGNLTLGGLRNNIEASLLVESPTLVKQFTKQLLEQLTDAPLLTKNDFSSIENLIAAQIEEIEKDALHHREDATEFNKKKQDVAQTNKLITLGKRIKPESIPTEKLFYELHRTTTARVSRKGVVTKKIPIRHFSTIIASRELLKRRGKKIKQKIEKILGEISIGPEKLVKIFIHPTYYNEHPELEKVNFNRLAFLGREILSCLFAWWAASSYKETRDAETLKEIINNLSSRREKLIGQFGITLKDYLVGAGIPDEEVKPFVVIESLESLLAILSLEEGFDKLKNLFIKPLKDFAPKDELKELVFLNYKTILMQIVQEQLKVTPTYRTLKQEGPDHMTRFTIVVEGKGIALGKGVGRSKKKAQEEGAKNALHSSLLKKSFAKWKATKEKSIIQTQPRLDLTSTRAKRLKTLASLLGISHDNLPCLNCALTRRSWCNDHKVSFAESCSSIYSMLGDFFWNLFLVDTIYDNSSIDDSKLKTVQNKLHFLKLSFFEKFAFGRYLRIGKGDQKSDMTENMKTQTSNAIIWILFLEGGFSKVSETLKKFLGNKIEEEITDEQLKIEGPVSFFQRIVQDDGLKPPVYEIVSYKGTAHKPEFRVAVFVNDNELGQGIGLTTSKARKAAAKEAIPRYLEAKILKRKIQ